MSKSIKILNEILVEIFNDILLIEQSALKQGEIGDLSITEVHTIEAIGMCGEKSMSEIAAKLLITVGTLTTAINNLIKKGYVERRREEKDRRVVLISLTHKGRIVYRVHERFHSNMIKEIITGLNEEETDILITSLEKLNDFFKTKYNLLTDKKE